MLGVIFVPFAVGLIWFGFIGSAGIYESIYGADISIYDAAVSGYDL